MQYSELFRRERYATVVNYRLGQPIKEDTSYHQFNLCIFHVLLVQ